MNLQSCRILIDKLKAYISGGRKTLRLLTPFLCAVILVILALVAAGDFFFSHSERRTITFYADDDAGSGRKSGEKRMEERFISHKSGKEEAVRSYIGEILLGPSFPGVQPLLMRGTRLETCFLRDGIVTAGFSVEAAFPVSSSGFGVLDRLKSIRDDIKRNFYYVRDVRFFIAGEDLDLPD
jgi:hypothetical protein